MAGQGVLTHSTSTAIPATPPHHVEGLGLPEGICARNACPDRPAAPARATRRNRRSGRKRDRDRGTAINKKRLAGLVSAEARGAFAIDREGPRLRDRYGRNVHGQCLLLARRLVEGGVRLVTVNWHNDGQNFWDTHGDNFNQIKNRLMPPAEPGGSRHCLKIWTVAACLMRRSWFGWESSAARHRRSSVAADVSIGRTVTRLSWQGARGARWLRIRSDRPLAAALSGQRSRQS